MKVRLFVTSLVALSSTAALAATNASPFGLELGVATLTDLQKQLGTKARLHDAGINAVTKGRMVETRGRGLGIDGLKSAFFVFDARDRLAVVELTFPKDFANASTNRTADLLNQKYREVQRDLPSVGDGEARYVQGDSIIILESPHMSFVYRVTYETNDFERAAAKRRAEQREQKAAATKAAL